MGNDIGLLIVDDDELITELLSGYLSAKGYTVKSVNSPGEAFPLIDSVGFDLVITDLKMEPVGGIAVIKYLHERGFRGKIILMSGFRGDMQEIANSFRVDYCIEKPFDLAHMLSKVREFTGALQR